MKVAVIGAGGVGSYYGGLLAKAGHDTWFLMRRDLEAVRARGLDIRSHLGDFTVRPAQAVATSEEIGPADLVICSLKATALDDARRLVEPCLGPETRLLALMNGLEIEETFAAWLELRRIFGGMAFVCINRGEPGVVHHLDYGTLTIGHMEDDPGELEAVREVLAGAGMDVVVAGNLRRARWEKLCWNVPFSGIGVAAGGVGTATVLGTPELKDLARTVIQEVVRVANADLESLGSPDRLDPEAMVRSMFERTATMGDYFASMVIDYNSGRPMEVDAILGAPVRRARALGIPAGAMQAIHALAVVAATIGRRRHEGYQDGS